MVTIPRRNGASVSIVPCCAQTLREDLAEAMPSGDPASDTVDDEALKGIMVSRMGELPGLEHGFF